MAESSNRMWSTGEGNGKPLQQSCLVNPMNSMKRQKDRKQKDEPPRSVRVEYAPGTSREIAPEGMKRLSQSRKVPSWDVPGGESRVQCYKDKRASLVAQ